MQLQTRVEIFVEEIMTKEYLKMIQTSSNPVRPPLVFASLSPRLIRWVGVNSPDEWSSSIHAHGLKTVRMLLNSICKEKNLLEYQIATYHTVVTVCKNSNVGIPSCIVNCKSLKETQGINEFFNINWRVVNTSRNSTLFCYYAPLNSSSGAWVDSNFPVPVPPFKYSKKIRWLKLVAYTQWCIHVWIASAKWCQLNWNTFLSLTSTTTLWSSQFCFVPLHISHCHLCPVLMEDERRNTHIDKRGTMMHASKFKDNHIRQDGSPLYHSTPLFHLLLIVCISSEGHHHDKKLSKTTVGNLIQVTIGSNLIGNQRTFNLLGRLITSPSLTCSNLLLTLPTSPFFTSLIPSPRKCPFVISSTQVL